MPPLVQGHPPGRKRTGSFCSVSVSPRLVQSYERTKGRTDMGKIVMSGPQNVSLDGVGEDPDGEEGFRLGGWFVRFGGKDLAQWNELALQEALSAQAWLLGRRS